MSRFEITPGVGLYFLGFPNDIERFSWILNKEGCHPKAVTRILDRLKVKGEDKLTVMSHLNFSWIKEELLKVNVQMSFIPATHFESKNDGEWPQELIDKIFKEKAYENRFQIRRTQENYKRSLKFVLDPLTNTPIIR